MARKWSTEDLAYLAGIIDGEGCIDTRLTKHAVEGRSPITQNRIRVGNSDLRLITWLIDTFGGTYSTHTPKRGRQEHFWQLSIRINSDLMRSVLPYLKLKDDQLQLALELLDLSIVTGRGRRVPPENLAQRRDICDRISQLKKVEYA